MEYLEFILPILFNFRPFRKIKQWIYSEKKFVEDIEIDVRSTNPVSFTLTSQIPTANIYLKITNKSQYLEAIFDRAVLSLWLTSEKGTQPVHHEVHIISKQKIEKKKTEEIFCSFDLNEAQIRYLGEIKESKRLSATLYLKIYIGSSLYDLLKEARLENKPCEIH